MSKIRRIDSVGTRHNLAGTEVANFCDKEQFVRMYVYLDDGETGDTLLKGSLVSLEYRNSGDCHVLVNGVATLAREHFGFGNVCKLSDTGDDVMKLFACGVLAESITLAAGGFAIVDVQVAGLFENALLKDAGVEGHRLFASNVPGESENEASADFDSSGPCIGVQLEAAVQDTGKVFSSDDSLFFGDIYLLDPFNLAE